MKFEKISLEQFTKDYNSQDAKEIYDKIKLPAKATKGSKGYDFFAPMTFVMAPGTSMVINTGIKCQLDDDKGLFIFPRSGLGFKYMLQLANTVGIIDVDYYGNESNEGHIKIKLHNGGDKIVKIAQGTAFAQGIILQCFDVEETEEPTKTRVGGFGSTTTPSYSQPYESVDGFGYPESQSSGLYNTFKDITTDYEPKVNMNITVDNVNVEVNDD